MLKFFIKYMLPLSLVFIFSTSIGFSTTITPEPKQLIKIGFHTVPPRATPSEAYTARQRFFRIFKEMEGISNYTFEFIPFTVADGISALKQGKIDLFGPIRKTSARQEYLAYMEQALDRAHISIAFKSKKGIFYNDLQSINGKTIATFHGNPYNKILNDYLRQHNINATLVYEKENLYHTLDTDFFLTISKNRNFKDFLSIYNLMMDKYYFVATKENEKLIANLDKSLTRVIAENGSLLENIFAQNGKNNTTKRYLTRAEMDKLRQANFSVGYTKEHHPIQFTNENGEPDGISIEILNKLSAKYGFGITYHAYDPSIAGDRKKYDILISSQDVIPDLCKQYIPTNTYLDLPIVLFLAKNIMQHTDNFIKKIGIYNYLGFDYSQIKEKFYNPEIIYFNSINDAVQAYFKGKIDAGLFTITGAEYITSLVGSDIFRMVGTELNLPLRMYISKDISYDYVEIFNLLFEHLDKSELNVIVSSQTINFTPKYSLVKIISEYKYHALMTVAIVLILIMLLVLYNHHKKRLAVLYTLNHDDITGLKSYYYFIRNSSQILYNANNGDYKIIYLDIDHYNLISKFYGYTTSKNIIVLMANTLREIYNDPTDIICRINAEQFIILHKKISSKYVEDVCEKQLMPAIQKAIGQDLCLSFSVGLCTINDTSLPIQVYIDRANQARVKGKHLHRNTYYTYNDNMQNKYERQAIIVSHMEQGIRDKEFFLYYQPKIDLNTLKINGAEALVRWHHADGTCIYPDEFISTFESNGFIENLDLYVFETVCQLLANNSNNTKMPTISINLSTYTLKNTSTPNKLKILLEQYNLKPPQIEIEITESALIDDDKILLAQVNALKKIGFTVSLDDFGSGVSTLNRLASLNVDIVKLDKYFLDFNISEQKGSIVVENVIRLTKDLKMQVVCEGVETVLQARWLKSLQCDIVQGHFFEKPLSETDFLERLQDDKTYSLE